MHTKWNHTINVGDGLLLEKLGVLNIFILILQIPTYLGSRGVLFFLQLVFFNNMLAPVNTALLTIETLAN